ncbi:MAG TPA: hypothetical protein VFV31_01020 [Chitinophagaceae bacterium]|nr:hypothetical protein [Chitinophagaceae bacterium]
MKPFLTTLFLLISALLFAQFTPQFIKKYKIASVIETSSFKEDGVPQVVISKTHYDNAGNDTAYYSGDILVYRKKYVLDESDRIEMVITESKSGNESERTTYTYETSGNYTTTSRHQLMDAVTIKWFNKSGRLLKEQREDGAMLFYDYNTKGQLVQVMTKLAPSGKGDIEHLKYTYNSLGRLIKEESLGTYRWTKLLYYDSRGILIKTITSGKEDGVVYTTTNTYQYTFMK